MKAPNATSFRTAVVVLAVLAAPAIAQRQPASVERRSMWDTPELRERLYDRAVERYRADLANAYELTGEQREQVAARLESLKREQVDYAARTQEEMRQLTAEMSELWRKRQSGEPVDEGRMEQLSGRMGELWREAPLLNPQRVADEIEKLLPAEQIAGGRPRWETARQERVRDWTERAGAFRGRAEPGVARGTDNWQRFVEAFCTEFGLDEAQRASAMSILRDVQARRDQYRQKYADDFEALQQVEDFALRGRRLMQLMEPVDRLYEEMQTRLDKIPTSAQIDAARQRLATRPAPETMPGILVPDGLGARSRTATATRPSDMVRVPGPDRSRGLPRITRTRPAS